MLRSHAFGIARTLTLSLAATAATSSAALAAKKPDSSFLQATVAPKYAQSAPAEVLYERGVLEFEFGRDDASVLLSVEKRIKIYSEEGYGSGTEYIEFFDSEDVSNIEACTWQVDGKKVKASDVHEMTMSETRRDDRRFSSKAMVVVFPSLAPGVILDLSYQIRRKNFVWIAPWYFQSALPCRESSFTARIPEGLIYSADLCNPSKIDIRDDVKEWQGMETVEAAWRADEAPPLTAERHGGNPVAQAARVFFSLEAYGVGGRVVQFWSGWASLNTLMLKVVENSQRQKTQAAVFAAARSGESMKEQIQSIQQAVLSRVAPTAYRGVLTLRTVDEIVASGAGDAQERAYVLLAALQAAGIDAKPVWVCGSDLVTPVNKAIPTQFTDVILWTDAIGSEGGYVHALDDFAPFQLPAHFEETLAFRTDGLGGEAFVIVGSPASAHTISSNAVLSLGDAGDLEGSIEIFLTGEPAARVREALRRGAADNVKAALAAWLREPLRDDVLSAPVVAVDEETGGVRATATISVPAFATRVEESFHFEVPFLSEERAVFDPELPHAIPLQFDFPYRQRETIAIEIPANFKARELPAPAKSSGQFANYDISMRADGQTLLARKQFELSERVVPSGGARELADIARAAHLAGIVDLTIEAGAAPARR